MAKVEAPNKDYNGPGPGDAKFENGVAEVDDDAALNYYRGAGYKVSGKVDSPVDVPEPADPREVTRVDLGTRLRDAAVDPEEGDFLAPINAGEGNPHGSKVISPEIHASGPSGIRPGDANVDDLGKQEAREKAFAEARLVEQASAREAVEQHVDLDDQGELGFSDPGSAEAGRRGAKQAATAEESDDSDAPQPAKKTAAKRAAKKS